MQIYFLKGSLHISQEVLIENFFIFIAEMVATYKVAPCSIYVILLRSEHPKMMSLHLSLQQLLLLFVEEQTTCTGVDSDHMNLAQPHAKFASNLQVTKRYAPLAILFTLSVHIIQRPPVCKLRPQLMHVTVKSCICINMQCTSSRPPCEHAKPYFYVFLQVTSDLGVEGFQS